MRKRKKGECGADDEDESLMQELDAMTFSSPKGGHQVSLQNGAGPANSHSYSASPGGGFVTVLPDPLANINSLVEFLTVSQRRIDSLIAQLRSGIVSAQITMEARFSDWCDYVTQQHEEAFSSIAQLTAKMKREVVEILRRVVDLISQSAVMLPVSLQSLVKRFILVLPERWVRSSFVRSSLYYHHAQNLTVTRWR